MVHQMTVKLSQIAAAFCLLTALLTPGGVVGDEPPEDSNGHFRQPEAATDPDLFVWTDDAIESPGLRSVLLFDKCEHLRRYDYAALVSAYGDGFDGKNLR
jgi:hypothetical protein